MNVIQIENLWKEYRLGVIGHGTLTHDLQSWWARKRGKEDPNSGLISISKGQEKQIDGDRFWALQNINLEVKQGDILGIIGKNGAGKSTLLKILSRVTAPSRGNIKVKGCIASLLEVGTGFHQELTGRENIFLNGAILGMSKLEVKNKFDEIVHFSGIEAFIDTPVKRYSSGMYVRLAFAVAAHLEPEILIIDEVLAVGDAEFQKRCLGKIGDIATKGRTVLFVSHNMAAIENICNKAVLVNKGKITFAGTQSETISEYQKSDLSCEEVLKGRVDRKGTGEVKIVGIELRDLEGCAIDSVVCGKDFDIIFNFETSPGFSLKRVVASFSVSTMDNVPVFLHHNRMVGSEFGQLPSRGAFVCRLLKLPLTPSTYRISYSIMNGYDYLDSITDALKLTVLPGDFFKSGELPPSSHGFCLVEGSWGMKEY